MKDKLSPFWHDFKTDPIKPKHKKPNSEFYEPINVALLSKVGDIISEEYFMTVGRCFFNQFQDNLERPLIFVDGKEVTDYIEKYIDLDEYFYMKGIF